MLIRISKISTLLALSLSLLFSAQTFADNTPAFEMNHQKSICGADDDREPSYEPRVARVLQRGARAGCTLTMIGSSCAVSAGHCVSTFEDVHFNTPLSQDGRIQLPEEEDVYTVDSTTIVSTNGGPGNDFAVVRLQRNELTGKYPGDVQGSYEVGFEMPRTGDTIRITGYGQDLDDDDRNFAQQVNMGPITRLNQARKVLYHRADTKGGNSGSSIINERTQKIIGIHTHGGCYSRGGNNMGTLIPAHRKAQEAIKTCLEWEEQNL